MRMLIEVEKDVAPAGEPGKPSWHTVSFDKGDPIFCQGDQELMDVIADNAASELELDL